MHARRCRPALTQHLGLRRAIWRRKRRRLRRRRRQPRRKRSNRSTKIHKIRIAPVRCVLRSTDGSIFRRKNIRTKTFRPAPYADGCCITVRFFVATRPSGRRRYRISAFSHRESSSPMASRSSKPVAGGSTARRRPQVGKASEWISSGSDFVPSRIGGYGVSTSASHPRSGRFITAHYTNQATMLPCRK